MSLRSKLSRLDGQSAGRGLAAPAALAPDPARAPPAAVLDELRERIRITLERGARKAQSAAAALPPVDTVDLPFATTDTPLGPLHVRTQRLSAAHRTGRAPIAVARSADAQVLSLLALDPRLAACDAARALYLDTETTGLSGGTGTIAFLVGLAWWDHGEPREVREREPALVLEQILVRALGEEAPMLARVRERLEAASLLVTFNGKSFDLPLLRTRFVMARAEAPAEPPHLDLLHVARRVHKQRQFKEGCRLVSLERDVLGFERSDDVESRDVSACYLHFLRTGDARGLLAVVEHNAWDVVAMAALVGVYGAPVHVKRRTRRTRRWRCPTWWGSRARCGGPGRSTVPSRWPTPPSSARARPTPCARGPRSPRRAAIATAPSPTSRPSRRWRTTPRPGWSSRRSTSTRSSRRRAPSSGPSGGPVRRPSARGAASSAWPRRCAAHAIQSAPAAAKASSRIFSASSMSRFAMTSDGATLRTLP